MDPEIVPGRTRGVKIILNFYWSRWQGKRGSLKQYYYYYYHNININNVDQIYINLRIIKMVLRMYYYYVRMYNIIMNERRYLRTYK